MYSEQSPRCYCDNDADETGFCSEHRDVQDIPRLRCMRKVEMVGPLVSHYVHRAGDVLTLKLEPDNPHDKNAVLVLLDGKRLGYLSRKDARRIQGSDIEQLEVAYLCPAPADRHFLHLIN